MAGVTVKTLIGALLITVVGLALLPTVITQANAVNVTGVVAGTLVTLIPMFYIILLIAGIVGFIKFGGN